jgi:beta-glucoside operon transcriptional antiterminator
MHLTKKINNNVAMGTDDSGHDVVVFGTGVGFRRMPYDIDDPRLIRDVSHVIVDAMTSIDDNVLLAASDIVDLARMELECKLNPNLPFTLADHIQFAIQRHKEGVDISNPLASEVSYVYPKELAVARSGVAMVNARVKGADLPAEEAFSIALHIVSGEAGDPGDESSLHLVMESTRVIHHVTAILEEKTGRTFDHASYAYMRFTAHLRYLVSRLVSEAEENSTNNSSLFEQASKDFPEVYSIASSIRDYFYEEYGWECSNEELLYLMMHVNRLITGT